MWWDCMYVGWLPAQRSDWNEESSLDIAVGPDLIRGGYSMQWYVWLFLYVNMYVWMYSLWWLLIDISPSIPIGERLPAMERSMAGKGTTRDGLKMEQQVFMVGMPLCMYASWWMVRYEDGRCVIVIFPPWVYHTVLGRVTLILSIIQDDSYVYVCMACTAHAQII